MVDLHQHLLDMLGAKDHADAGRIIGELQGMGMDRARETPRRQSAVELLLSLGYVWRTDRWEAPQPAVAPGLNQSPGNSGQLPPDAVGVEPAAWYFSSAKGEIGVITVGGYPSEQAIEWGERYGHTLNYLYTTPPAPAAVPAPDLSRTIAQLNRMRIVLRNARAYVESFTCKSALPPVQQKMIGQIDEVLGALAHAWPTAVPGEGPLSGKYGAVLRPFVAMMERELHANAGKGDRPGWLSMDSSTALLEIYHHMGKLQRATKNADEPGIVEYAADVANMAMMLVDVFGLLPVDGDTTPQPAAAKEHAHWPQIKLWFFRELNAAQRATLFTLCGLGCDGESMASHSAETMVLRAIIDQRTKPEVQ
ncbi:hypothetical protein D0A35_05390 [Xanthomonas campestris]|nr:hypothetical protein D0A35_05390 [Xanthomonas campestris]